MTKFLSPEEERAQEIREEASRQAAIARGREYQAQQHEKLMRYLFPNGEPVEPERRENRQSAHRFFDPIGP